MTLERHLARTIALGAALCLTSCQEDPQLRILSDQIRALESAQAQDKAEVKRLQMQMRSLQSERDKIKEERDKLLPQLEEARNALDSLRKEFEAYKQHYKLSIRKRAPGMELEAVEVGGKRYEKVVIRDLTETSLVFIHQAGTMSVQLNQLKPEMQERLGYSPPSSVPVMVKHPPSTATTQDLEAEMLEVEKKLGEVRKLKSDLVRSLNENSRAENDERFKSDGDPTVYRTAAAAIRVKLNELDVEERDLYVRNKELADLLRARRLR